MCRSHRVAVARGTSGPRRFGPGRTLSLTLLVVLVVSASPGMAANGTWSSSASSGTWQTTTNWLSGIVPGATSGTTNSDTANFNSSSSTTLITPDLNRNLENIIFDTSAAQYVIGLSISNALLLTSGGEIEIASTISGSNLTESVAPP